MKTLSLMLALCVLLLTIPAAAAQEAGPAVYGYFNDPTLHGGRVPMYFSQPTSPADAESRPAGLAQLAPAPAMDLEQSSHCASFAGPNYSVCVVASSGASAAKPAGMAQPIPVSAVGSAQGWPGCPWGYDHNPACQSGPDAPSQAASKSAGLAQPAPAVAEETFVPCGFGERLDPLALACRNAVPVEAAAKPAGLAQVFSSTENRSGIAPYRGRPYGVQTPAREPGPAGQAGQVCPGAAGSVAWRACKFAAAKPAGLTQPAPVTKASEGWPGCPWCYRRAASSLAKPAGLAQPAPVEEFVPCGFGERLDPLALACQQPVPAVNAAAKPAGLAQPAPATSEQQSVPCGPELASATVSGRLSCQ
jgi:hypothetical protein